MMYSKQEISISRQQFWTAFGQYLAPVPSASGEKINWVNYKTGVRYVRFLMDINNLTANISIEISEPGKEARCRLFEKLQSLKIPFDEMMGTGWVWQADAVKDHRTVSLVYKELNGVNAMDKTQWPALISFFKEEIIALDAFWNEYKFVFDF